MRKWFIPLAVLGMGGIGALFFTERGRRGLRWVWEHAHEAPDALADFNERAQHELDRIEATLNRLASTLEGSSLNESNEASPV